MEGGEEEEEYYHPPTFNLRSEVINKTTRVLRDILKFQMNTGPETLHVLITTKDPTQLEREKLMMVFEACLGPTAIQEFDCGDPSMLHIPLPYYPGFNPIYYTIPFK
ncbi:hypothetical protein FIBSPDRAFT_885805 [Athelia psychrophila]|uniref:Uncharacterized protein n=1 Tax=Athelia psychrophila TaxID=1759441 RepID=A0A166RF69_9AGAM|nr:hypothetical protein FIBSPDRAFT_885805 [Fibularhizoctonia sp. CBS 109695]